VALAAHTLSIGPETYYLQRTRASGTKQNGFLYGGQFAYNYIKNWMPYFGADTYAATGVLHGHNASGRATKSDLTDWQIEARIGYTLPCITIFGGYGYLLEQLNFVPPSATTFHYRDCIQYVTTGFLSRVNWTKHFSTGFNAKIKMMLEGKCHVSNDPANTPITLLMENELQYRLDLLFNYIPACPWELSCAPFYEFRHYGGHESFPYDFIDTVYHIYGVQLNCNYWF
jgi:hypothetical protein